MFDKRDKMGDMHQRPEDGQQALYIDRGTDFSGVGRGYVRGFLK